MSSLTLALPSKGRLMDQARDLFARAGLEIVRDEAARGYQGRIAGLERVTVTFLSSGEIAEALKNGAIDAGVTGEDLLHEAMADLQARLAVPVKLGFGPADVVVAVPECWLDVAAMADLDEVAETFYRNHGRRLRVATKYVSLTRRFFADKGVRGYRIVESLGATEGAPAAGSAELITDITTTGSTLAANRLKILDDGVILKSQAVLAVRQEAVKRSRARDLVKALTSAVDGRAR